MTWPPGGVFAVVMADVAVICDSYEARIDAVFAIIESARPAWHAQAACRGHDPDLWFPGRGDCRSVAAAVAICRACPVTQQCLAFALGPPAVKEGIWGALPARRRRILRHQLRRAGWGGER